MKTGVAAGFWMLASPLKDFPGFRFAGWAYSQLLKP
jgi:hypothetical protein